MNSDGDSSPGEVAHWYRDHGYDFLVLSDHNYRTAIDELQKEFDRETSVQSKGSFLFIPGEEVTSSFDKIPVHTNGVDTQHSVQVPTATSKTGLLQAQVDAIHAAGGVASVNHPNFRWALTARDLASLRHLKHFEIFNGHPHANNSGGGAYQSLEEMWDEILSNGIRLFGVAVDDAHHFQVWGSQYANPGRGFIMVRAASLSREAIRQAFENGNFYASTGVLLDNIEMAAGTLSIRIKANGDAAFRTYFIGDNGRVLGRSTSLTPSYTLKKRDDYVRARIVSSRGEYAWTQPLFRNERPYP